MQKPYCGLAGMEYRRILEEMSQFDITEYQLNLQWYRLQGICFANRNALQYLQVLEKNTRLASRPFCCNGTPGTWRLLFQNKSKTLDLNGYHFLKAYFYWYSPIETKSLIPSKKSNCFFGGNYIIELLLLVPSLDGSITCKRNPWHHHMPWIWRIFTPAEVFLFSPSSPRTNRWRYLELSP